MVNFLSHFHRLVRWKLQLHTVEILGGGALPQARAFAKKKGPRIFHKIKNYLPHNEIYKLYSSV